MCKYSPFYANVVFLYSKYSISHIKSIKNIEEGLIIYLFDF